MDVTESVAGNSFVVILEDQQYGKNGVKKKCFLLVLNSITSKAMGFWTMPGKSQNDKRKKKKKGKLEKEGGGSKGWKGAGR